MIDRRCDLQQYTDNRATGDYGGRSFFEGGKDSFETIIVQPRLPANPPLLHSVDRDFNPNGRRSNYTEVPDTERHSFPSPCDSSHSNPNDSCHHH